LFLFPTFSENYGHVILEALLSGCPVLISDQTFWRNLEKEGVGWDVSLDNPQLFRDVLVKCINMNFANFQNISQKAMQYGIDQINNLSSVNEHRKMFRAIIASEN
jgi:glycosyltransferase involved in cell wall biosynthesis